jgi:hypothetical protein
MLSRQPTGRWRRRSGSVSGSEGERAVSAARAARRAALKPYRKFSHGGPWQGPWQVWPVAGARGRVSDSD